MTAGVSFLRFVGTIGRHCACLSVLWLVWDEPCGVGKPHGRGLDWRRWDLLVKSWPMTCTQRPFDSTDQLILMSGLWTICCHLSHSRSWQDRITWAYKPVCYMTEEQLDSWSESLIRCQEHRKCDRTLQPLHQPLRLMSHCFCESFSENLDYVEGETMGSLITFPGAPLFLFHFLTRPSMFPALGIIIILKANLSSFNIKFKNCYSLSARQHYKSIRLRNKPQRGFTMKGYLAGELLCSLVSQDFQTLQMEGMPPQLKHSWGRATDWRMNQGHFFIYMQVLHATNVWFWFFWCMCLFYVSQEGGRESIKCPWKKCYFGMTIW